jgi:transposase
VTATERDLRAELETARALIRQQAEQLSHLAEQNKVLAAQVEVLQEELRKNSSNSSKPPSSDSPAQRERNRRRRARRSSGRRRGGQPKHKGSFRPLASAQHVDRVVPLYPEQCINCWGKLPQTCCDRPRRYQVVELTRGGVELTEYQRHLVSCPTCGFQSWASSQGLPRSPFGTRLQCIVVMLTGVYHLSRRQTQRLLHDLWEIRISLGAISAIEKRMSRLLAPVYERAKELADNATIKHTDGTGWRQAGCALQLWTVATRTVTVFSIVRDGSAVTLRALFGRIKGILISDRAKAINFWKMNRRQICWSHLLRKFIAFSERDGPAGQIGAELVEHAAVVFATYRAWQRGISRGGFSVSAWRRCVDISRLCCNAPSMPTSSACPARAQICLRTNKRCGPSSTAVASSPPITTPSASCVPSCCGANGHSGPTVIKAIALPSAS